MPSFDVSIAGAPIAFSRGCKLINDLYVSNQSVFNSLLTEAWRAIHTKNHEHRIHHQHNAYETEYRTILYILKSKCQSNPAANKTMAAAVLDSLTYLTRDTIAEIVTKAEEEQNEAATIPDGEIISRCKGIYNFRWKIGAAIASSGCKSLAAPYVAIAFDVPALDGTFTSHTAELSYSEFQDFHRTFTNVASVMDSL